MNKNLSIISMFTLALMLVTSVIALDLSMSRWNTSGSVGLMNINLFDGLSLNWASGKYNAHLNLQRGVEGEGYIYVQAKDSNGNLHRATLNWLSRTIKSCTMLGDCGTYGGITIVSDTSEETVFTTGSRLIYDRNVEYGVLTQVTYNKLTNSFAVKTLDGRFDFSV